MTRVIEQNILKTCDLVLMITVLLLQRLGSEELNYFVTKPLNQHICRQYLQQDVKNMISVLKKPNIEYS